MAKSDTKRFCRRLDSVADEFGTSRAVVVAWRDNDNCPFLQSAPYDIAGVRAWLDEQVELRLSETRELEREKLEREIEALRTKSNILSKDKSFWLAAAALGIVLTREMRGWLDGEDEPERERRAIIFAHGVSASVRQEFDRIARQEARSTSHMLRFVIRYAFENRQQFGNLESDADAQNGNDRLSALVSQQTRREFSEWAHSLNLCHSMLLRRILTRYLDLHKPKAPNKRMESNG